MSKKKESIVDKAIEEGQGDAITKRRVSYFFDCDVGNYHYGQGHPMKPHRVRMTHSLVVNYNLYKRMEIFRPGLVTAADMTRFHSDDYINFLHTITPDNMGDYLRQLQRFNVGEDCPVFDGYLRFENNIHEGREKVVRAGRSLALPALVLRAKSVKNNLTGSNDATELVRRRVERVYLE
eukprot:g5358.t1